MTIVLTLQNSSYRQQLKGKRRRK